MLEPRPLAGNHAAAELQIRLARVWLSKGNPDKAILSYQKALDLDPGLVAASLELGNSLRDQGRADEAISIFKGALEQHPNKAELHKALIAALVEQHSLSAAFDYYQLERLDAKELAPTPGALLCCVVVHDEALRLPYFLAYYRQLGVSHFLIVDNGSSDGTLPLLLAQPDVYVWRSALSFNRANFGAAWFELLLRQYGRGHWSLIVDADELLVYSNSESRSLPQLCRELDAGGKRVLDAILLDMYSDQPIAATRYDPGQPFLAVCPYFDRAFYHARYENWSPYHNQTTFFGGMRQRVFGAHGAYNLSKTPLIKYDLDCILAGGQHWTNRPSAEIAGETACLLHFKYFATFPSYVQKEVRRKEHYRAAMQYEQYAAGLDATAALTLYDENESLRYSSSAQLVSLGIITPPASAPADHALPLAEFPPIMPLAPATTRPFWSVMITAYNRSEYLARALRSVLDQAPGAEQMQIEVVNDAADPVTAAQLAAIVRELGGERVSFFRLDEHAGHPYIFNRCIERARGYWVHILHDDDWVEPGFYAALAAGISSAPQVGAAFCRQVRDDEAGDQQWLSRLERATPGLIEQWLDRIAVKCRVQFASIVVKRAAYEALGGFCPQAASSFDWHMWKRLAVRFPVWYEPRALAHFIQGPLSETHRLVRSGEQIAHARQAIKIARLYLPPDRADELSYRANQHYARYALEVARDLWRRGEHAAARANIREGLLCSPTEELQRALAAMSAPVGSGSI